MSFAAAVERLNGACLRTFGDDVTVTVEGSLIDLLAVYLAPYQREVLPGLEMEQAQHRMVVSTVDWAAAGAVRGGVATISGRRYYIADIHPDDGGMTDVILRPAA